MTSWTQAVFLGGFTVAFIAAVMNEDKPWGRPLMLILGGVAICTLLVSVLT